MKEGLNMLTNKLTDLLNIKYPIIQAPMAGGVTTSELVAAVSNNGALGMIGAGYLTADQMREQIREIKKVTSKSFGVNLFVPNKFTVSADAIKSSNETLQPIRDELNLPPRDQVVLPSYIEAMASFEEQIQVILDEKIAICSYTFGLPSNEMISQLKEHSIIQIGTATTVQEALEAEKCGMDLVVIQGIEAGGHRGNFINEFEESQIGLMSLIPQVVDAVSIPVIAAGGIMDGRGLLASLCLGAKYVQMGTAFLTCVESGAPDIHKEAILHATEDQTVLTRSFSGKWARGVKNKFIDETQPHQLSFPDFPIQNTLTQDIRKGSGSQKNPAFMSLWSGQSPRLAKIQTVETLIQTVMAEVINLKKSL